MTAPIAKFEIERVPHSQGTLLRLKGTLNETFDLPGLIAGAGSAEVVVLDLDQVPSITSFGVREWISSLRSIPASYLAFINCRPALVAQFNMVFGFAGQGHVVSIFLPYMCERCNHSFEELLDLRHQAALALIRSAEIPPAKCPKCDGPAGFDDLPEVYFSYLASQPVPEPPARVNALIDGTSEPASSPLRIAKEVVGDVTAIWLQGTIGTGGQLRRLGEGLEGHVLLLMDEVEGMSPQGAVALKAILDLPDVEITLARVPPNILSFLARDPSVLGRARVTSARIPLRCKACEHHVFTDRELSTLDGFAKGEPAGACPHCTAPLSPVLAVDDLPAWSQLPQIISQGEVREYLDANVERTAGRVGSGTGSQVAAGLAGNLGQEKYQLLKRIGVGGMAELFLARQVGPGGFEKRVALKCIHSQLANEPAFIEMFLQEAKLAARISHPNVAQIFDLGRLGERYFIAMEYVKGLDLDGVLHFAIQLQRKMPVELACRIVAEICGGLSAAHNCENEKGEPLHIVHRDVSPHNVLISNDGLVKLVDFGIAKAAGSISSTRPGSTRGKTSYMAPEQAMGQSVDHRVDLFATGIILQQCLTLVHPFRRTTDIESFQAILNDSVTRLSLSNPQLTAALQVIVDKALERDPARRYSSAQAMQIALEAVLSRFALKTSASHLAEWVLGLAKDAKAAGIEPRNRTAPHAPGSSESSGKEVEEQHFSNETRPSMLLKPEGSGKS